MLAGVVWYGVRISNLTLLSHERMATLTSDLGEFDNLFFNALRGHPFRAPAIEGELSDWSALKVHAEFSLYLLLPFYALAPGPEALLRIQSWTVALTAVPIFLLARRRIGAWAAVVVAFAFLLFPAVQRPNFYDFHFPPVGMFFGAWTLYFLDVLVAPETGSRRARTMTWVGFSAAFVCALASREELSFGLGLVGLFVAFSGASLRLGLSMAALGLGYFATMKFVVMPRFGEMWFHGLYESLKAPGFEGFRAIVFSLLTNPILAVRRLIGLPKLLYVLHMSVPLAFLWFRRPSLLLAAVPGVPFTILVTDRPPPSEIGFQYTYFWMPYLFAASILGLELLRRRGQLFAGMAALAIAAGIASHHYGALLGAREVVGGFSARNLRPLTESERTRIATLRELLPLIPPDASVAATEEEGPHVSTRLVLCSLKFTLGKQPDYLLIEAGGGDVGRLGYPKEREHVARALRSGEYGLERRAGEFILLKRGANPEQNAALLRELRL